MWEFLIKHYFCLKNNIIIAIISKKVSKIISKIKPTDFEQTGRLKCLLLNTKREKSNNFFDISIKFIRLILTKFSCDVSILLYY